jgi:hypothetical protein
MTKPVSDVEQRIRAWHRTYSAEGGAGPNAEAIREGLVAHWWDVDALLGEIDQLREHGGA